MPRRVARQRSYDIPFVAFWIEPMKLAKREVAAVARVLGRSPSPAFVSAYCHMLATYKAHHEAVTSSTAAKVQQRIGDLANSVKKLEECLGNLQLTDRRLLDDVSNERFLRGVRSTGSGDLKLQLHDLLQVAQGALLRLSGEEKRGRMPGYAEQAIASELCRILFEESGKKPTAKKGDTFDRLLRLAFDQSAISPPREDVVDLMRSALRDLMLPLPPGIESVLSLYKTRDNERLSSPSDTGTIKRK